MFLPVAEYRPDVANTNSAYSGEILNVLPADGSVIPMPQLVLFTETLDEKPLAGFFARQIDNSVRIIVGTANNFRALNPTTLEWDYLSKVAADQVTNGTFAADTDWSKATGWTITGGVARATAAANGATITQTQTLTASTVYKVVYTVSGYSAGSVQARFGGGTAVVGTARTANGTYTEYMTSTGNTNFGFIVTGTTTLDIDTVTVQALTIYAASDDEPWAFAQFGDFVVAVNANDDPQVFELGVSNEFEDLAGSPPRARIVQAVGPFLMLGNLTSNQNRVHWSGLEDIEEWTPGTNNCDFQDFPEGGQVVGITRSKDPLILMQKGVYRGMFMPGSREIFAFDKLQVELGAVSPRSIAANGEIAFFNDLGGFYQAGYDGSLARIGFEKVDKTIRAAVTSNDMTKVQGIIDPVYPRAYFFANDGTTTQFNIIHTYDWAMKQWAPIRVETVCPMIAATPGYTLDGIGALYPDLDALPFSLDSSFWQAGNPQIAAFQVDEDGGYRLGFFTGAPMEATVASQEMGDPNGVKLVTGVFPVCDAVDASAVTVEIGARFRLADTHVYTAPSGLSSNTGWAHKKSRARFHKVRISIAEGASWNNLKGAEIKAIPAGSR